LFRRQVIVKMLTDFFFPAFFKEVREELTKDGEEIIVETICNNFKRKLLVPPNPQRMLAMVLEDKKLGIVYVDESGKPHSPLQITLVND
jgi:transcriptional accessory protein Tex/SPT6